MSTRPRVLAWQLAALVLFVGLGWVSGLGLRVWLVLLGLGCGATCHAWWERNRGAGPLDLPEIRRTTLLSAGVIGPICAAASLAANTAPLQERIIAAVGAALITAFITGVLTLCGLSLGLGSDQPVTATLPDPAHPERGRRRHR